LLGKAWGFTGALARPRPDQFLTIPVTLTADADTKLEVADSTRLAFQSALDLTADHQLPMWDALILCVAAESRGTLRRATLFLCTGMGSSR
jgi:hypothetical protein